MPNSSNPGWPSDTISNCVPEQVSPLSRFSFPILFPDSLSRFSFPILFPDEHLADVVSTLVCNHTVLAFVPTLQKLSGRVSSTD
jgi:hypothetical protein